jgi:predicted transcriptional regulator
MEPTNQASDALGSCEERIEAALQAFREQFPDADYGRTLTKDEEEAILGFGPFGV